VIYISLQTNIRSYMNSDICVIANEYTQLHIRSSHQLYIIYITAYFRLQWYICHCVYVFPTIHQVCISFVPMCIQWWTYLHWYIFVNQMHMGDCPKSNERGKIPDSNRMLWNIQNTKQLNYHVTAIVASIFSFLYAISVRSIPTYNYIYE